MTPFNDSFNNGLFSHYSVSLFLMSAIFCTAIMIFLLYWHTHKALWSTRKDLYSTQKSSTTKNFILNLTYNNQNPIIALVWPLHSQEFPEITGSTHWLISDESDILTYDTWVSPLYVPTVEEAMKAFHTHGENFTCTFRTHRGLDVHMNGLCNNEGRGVVIRLLSALPLQHPESLSQDTEDRRGIFLELLNLIPHPLWVRTKKGRLTWVNKAYLQAVDSSDMVSTLMHQTELLDTEAAQDLEKGRLNDESCNVCATSVIRGERRIFHLIETSTPGGFFGIATDISKLEEARTELTHVINAHRQTLDKISTAIAIFNENQRLIFYNAAYQTLWKFETSFLESHPADTEILETLRSRNLLPEQANFRAWQTDFLSTYTNVDAREHWWHLPDGRTLRVLATPVLRGGVTYILDDVSELFLLESRYNGLIRVQRETLDSLKESVAVFGSDGCLTLFNPSFMHTWSLDSSTLEGRPHIDLLMELCRPLLLDSQPLIVVRNAVVGLSDKRDSTLFRVHHINNTVFDGSVAPLPDGSTLLTFTDVSASVNIERALTERNDALQHAARLRDNFVHHVSYELRSPLTTILGFIQLFKESKITNLTRKQRDYIDHIARSSSSLLVIMNDILDLATIEKGTVELDYSPVDLKETIYAALRGLEDRLAESKTQVVVDISQDIGHFIADAKRLRQIIFNLLSNAINLSKGGQRIRISAYEVGNEIVLSVADEGHQISPEIQMAMARQLEEDSPDPHPGIGLGLSIVRSFVELHGGTVALESHPEGGTVITCRFPVQGLPQIDRDERIIA